MFYRTSPSVKAVRTPSIRAGLVAATVTPGRTPTEVSRTISAIELSCCVDAATGSRRAIPNSTIPHRMLLVRLMVLSPLLA
jgi:hypothetical protein